MRPTATQRGYDSKWQKARAGYLAHHPLCVMCAKQGKQVKATVVDHIKPHRSDKQLFWDRNNWAGLCSWHHNSTKQQIEKRGYSIEIGKDGWPTDPNHPALAQRTRRNGQ